jgi:hypothetical protein
MSVGPLGGVASSAAGAPLALGRGSEIDRAKQDAVAARRQADGARLADSAAGVGATDGEEHAAHERDGDGRRLWELPPDKEQPTAEPDPSSPAERRPRDASGVAGTHLDLSG